MPTLRPRFTGRGERGVTSLFITLIVIMVVMLLAVTTAYLAGTQFLLSGNLQRENDAFNLAEGAIASAHNFLTTGGSTSPGFDTYDGAATPYLYPRGALTSDPLTMQWDNTNSRRVDADGKQRYLIEKIGHCLNPPGQGTELGTGKGNPLEGEKQELFRVTARGVGPKDTPRVIQTVFTLPNLKSKAECY